MTAEDNKASDNGSCGATKACMSVKALKGPLGMILGANAILLAPYLLPDRWFSWVLYLCLAVLALGFVAKKINKAPGAPSDLIKVEMITSAAECVAKNGNKFITFSHSVVTWEDSSLSLQACAGICGLVLLSWIFWPLQLVVLAVNGFLCYPVIMEHFGTEINNALAQAHELSKPHLEKAKVEIEKVVKKIPGADKIMATEEKKE